MTPPMAIAPLTGMATPLILIEARLVPRVHRASIFRVLELHLPHLLTRREFDAGTA